MADLQSVLHHIVHVVHAYRGQIAVLQNEGASGFVASIEVTDNQMTNLNPKSAFAPMLQMIRQRLMTTDPNVTVDEMDTQQFDRGNGSRLLRCFIRVRRDSQMPQPQYQWQG